MKNDEHQEQAYQEGEKDTHGAVTELEKNLKDFNNEVFDLKMKISKYEDILREIASSSEQANPKHLIDKAKTVLIFYAEKEYEPTTADEFNEVKEVGKKIR